MRYVVNGPQCERLLEILNETSESEEPKQSSAQRKRRQAAALQTEAASGKLLETDFHPQLNLTRAGGEIGANVLRR
jgi:hypothetical protein